VLHLSIGMKARGLWRQRMQDVKAGRDTERECEARHETRDDVRDTTNNNNTTPSPSVGRDEAPAVTNYTPRMEPTLYRRPLAADAILSIHTQGAPKRCSQSTNSKSPSS
jgi:hypothetical protein